MSQTVIFHHRCDRSILNDVNRTRTERYLGLSSFVPPVTPVQFSNTRRHDSKFIVDLALQGSSLFNLFQLVDGAMEVEVLMQRMVELQQQEEECTQEEMVTRFERERSESIPTGTNTPV